MLRMYVTKQCFGLYNKRTEDVLHDSQAIRSFVGIDLSREAASDATTVLKFRRLLEAHQLTSENLQCTIDFGVVVQHLHVLRRAYRVASDRVLRKGNLFACRLQRYAAGTSAVSDLAQGSAKVPLAFGNTA